MLSAWQAIILGLVQGLTEFLPVSSSGHLVIVQALFQIDQPMITFNVFVHLGTLVAVFAVFWDDIKRLIRNPLNKTVALLIVGTIPGALLGFFLNDIFEQLFSSLIAVAIALIITGIFLHISDRIDGKKEIADLSFKSALLIGLFQGLAISPGLSRSGSTIFGSILCGLKREEAARFSFLLSIPIILGAGAKQVLDMSGQGGLNLEWTFVLGALIAAISGYFAIKLFLKLLAKRNLRYFSYYCWFIALVLLLSGLF